MIENMQEKPILGNPDEIQQELARREHIDKQYNKIQFRKNVEKEGQAIRKKLWKNNIPGTSKTNKRLIAITKDNNLIR